MSAVKASTRHALGHVPIGRETGDLEGTQLHHQFQTVSRRVRKLAMDTNAYALKKERNQLECGQLLWNQRCGKILSQNSYSAKPRSEDETPVQDLASLEHICPTSCGAPAPSKAFLELAAPVVGSTMLCRQKDIVAYFEHKSEMADRESGIMHDRQKIGLLSDGDALRELEVNTRLDKALEVKTRLDQAPELPRLKKNGKNKTTEELISKLEVTVKPPPDMDDLLPPWPSKPAPDKEQPSKPAPDKEQSQRQSHLLSSKQMLDTKQSQRSRSKLIRRDSKLEPPRLRRLSSTPTRALASNVWQPETKQQPQTARSGARRRSCPAPE